MKFIGRVLLLCMIVFYVWWNTAFAQSWFDYDGHVLTDKESYVIGTEIKEKDDPLRGGALSIVDGTEGIYVNQDLYNEHSTGLAWERTTNYIKGITNYFLWLLWLVALVYLLFHWFMVLTAGADEEKSKKGMQWVKYAWIAIAWLWLAWFFLSLVFWLIQYLTNA